MTGGPEGQGQTQNGQGVQSGRQRGRGYQQHDFRYNVSYLHLQEILREPLSASAAARARREHGGAVWGVVEVTTSTSITQNLDGGPAEDVVLASVFFIFVFSFFFFFFLCFSFSSLLACNSAGTKELRSRQKERRESGIPGSRPSPQNPKQGRVPKGVRTLISLAVPRKEVNFGEGLVLQNVYFECFLGQKSLLEFFIEYIVFFWEFSSSKSPPPGYGPAKCFEVEANYEQTNCVCSARNRQAWFKCLNLSNDR